MSTDLKQRIHTLHQSHLFRYLIVGGTAFLTEYGSFYALYQAGHVQLYLANSISFCCGLIVSFIFNRAWTFNKRVFAHKTHHQALMYAVLGLINLGMINALVGVLKHLGVDPRIGKLIGQLTIVTWNFVIYRKIIFVSEIRES